MTTTDVVYTIELPYTFYRVPVGHTTHNITGNPMARGQQRSAYWWRLTKQAKKQAEADGWALGIDARYDYDIHAPFSYRLRVYTRTRGRRDGDNYLAGAKSFLDGVAAGLVIDDSQMHCVGVEFEKGLPERTVMEVLA